MFSIKIRQKETYPLMAIYHLRVSTISRGTGRSSTAATAYRSGENITDERTGITFDYSKKQGVDHTEIITPDNAPDWAQSRSALWNAVEQSEKRKDARVCREVRLALPAELPHAERVRLTAEYVREQFVDRGMVADIAIHGPDKNGDERNHHAHILLTTREIGPDGFGGKDRSWNDKALLETWREAWSSRVNTALERSGSVERVDHRTLTAQRTEALEKTETAEAEGKGEEAVRQAIRAVALDRDPLPQLSTGAWQRKERGLYSPSVEVWHKVQQARKHVRTIVKEFREKAWEWFGQTIEASTAHGPQEAYAGSVPGKGESREGSLPEIKPTLAEQLRRSLESLDSDATKELRHTNLRLALERADTTKLRQTVERIQREREERTRQNNKQEQQKHRGKNKKRLPKRDRGIER